MVGSSSFGAGNEPSNPRLGHRLRLSRVVLAVSVVAWCALLWAPVPWILPGTSPMFSAFGYGAGWVIPFGALVVIFSLISLAASSPRGSQGLTDAGVVTAVVGAPVNAWLWCIIVIGSFDPSVVLARHDDEYRAMADACLNAGTLRTMAERRQAVDVLPTPPDEWTASTTCTDLAFEVASFERDRRCPRSLPNDPCQCGPQQWPTDRPSCERGTVLCARVPGDSDESATRLQCVP
jgi:hypothetical protein